ncbi:uncharacterized protein [Elaeis guineensis]
MEWYKLLKGSILLGMVYHRETIHVFLVYFQKQDWKFLRCWSMHILFGFRCCYNFVFTCFRYSQGKSCSSHHFPPMIGLQFWTSYPQDGTIICGQNEISHLANGHIEPINKEGAASGLLMVQTTMKR